MIMMVTGGARSGKSSFAEKKIQEVLSSQPCADCSGKPQEDHPKVLYIATGVACDEEMEDRIRKHKEQRPKGWVTLEKFKDFGNLNDILTQNKCEAVLMDCLGFMLNNLIFYSDINFEEKNSQVFEKIEEDMLRQIHDLCSECSESHVPLIVVTNEVGMGLVPGEETSRYYRDILGRANRYMAELADQVYVIFSGIPVKLK